MKKMDVYTTSLVVLVRQLMSYKLFKSLFVSIVVTIIFYLRDVFKFLMEINPLLFFLVVGALFFLKEYLTEIFKGEDFQYYEDNTYTRSQPQQYVKFEKAGRFPQGTAASYEIIFQKKHRAVPIFSINSVVLDKTVIANYESYTLRNCSTTGCILILLFKSSVNLNMHETIDGSPFISFKYYVDSQQVGPNEFPGNIIKWSVDLKKSKHSKWIC